MERLKRLFELINIDLFQSRGLRLLWPRRVGFLFLEIEFYVSAYHSFPFRVEVTRLPQ
jgi:hypothetical protein